MALLDPARPQAAVMIATAYARMDETGQAAEAARRGAAWSSIPTIPSSSRSATRC